MIKLLHIGLSANSNPPNGLQTAFRKHFNYVDINTAMPDLNNKVLKMADFYKPDIVFMQIQREGIIKPETAKQLKDMGCFVINFTGDVRAEIPKWYIDIAPFIDLTVFTNYTDVYKMRELGFNAEFAELGIDPNIYNPNGQRIISKPVLFFANNYGESTFPLSKERIELVNYFKKKCPDEFAIYGTGWKNADGNLNHSQHIEASYYRGAKIAINISHFNYDQYSSDRLVRILGTGTMCLSKYFINAEKRFVDGKHLRYWETFEELEELIKYYLTNNEEREFIAKRGCWLAHREYTFENLILNIKKFYEQR